MKKSFLTLFIAIFVVFSIGPLPHAEAQSLSLPQVVIKFPKASSIVKGLTIHPENPLQFDFIVEPNGSNVSQVQLKEESMKMIKYFLASLTTPQEEMWVNLSPYEKNRIIPDIFGQTLMGRDLLADDYILKQMTASLIHPDTQLGKEFWSKVYAQAQAKYGTTQIPINTFNKVWIMPDKATVWEHGNSVFVIERHLKVMLEEDYVSMSKHENVQQAVKTDPSKPAEISTLGNQIVRDIVIPALEHEVNEGQSFAQLRQIYNAMILATWYKKRLKDSLLGQIYMNKNKINGINYTPTRGHVLFPRDVSPRRLPSELPLKLKVPQVNPLTPNDIYQQYIQTFKKGVFNFIKEEPDPVTHEMIPRKYFSGGVVGLQESNLAMISAPLSRLPDNAQAALPTNKALKITFNAVATNPSNDVTGKLASRVIKSYTIKEKLDIIAQVLERNYKEMKDQSKDFPARVDLDYRYASTNIEYGHKVITNLVQGRFMMSGKKFGDIGAGTGIMLVLAAALTDVEEVIGIEPDPVLMMFGKRIIEELHNLGVLDKNRIRWISAKWQETPEIIESLDAAYFYSLSQDAVLGIKKYLRKNAYLVTILGRSGWGEKELKFDHHLANSPEGDAAMQASVPQPDTLLADNLLGTQTSNSPTATLTDPGRLDVAWDWLINNPYIKLTDASIVDIGSSEGWTSLDLAKKLQGVNSSVEVIAVEPRPGLAIATNAKDLPRSIKFVEDDHRLLKTKTAHPIKVITMFNLAYYFPGKQDVLIKEASQKLEEGGLMLVGQGESEYQTLEFIVFKKYKGELLPIEMVSPRYSRELPEHMLQYWLTHLPKQPSNQYYYNHYLNAMRDSFGEINGNGSYYKRLGFKHREISPDYVALIFDPATQVSGNPAMQDDTAMIALDQERVISAIRGLYKNVDLFEEDLKLFQQELAKKTESPSWNLIGNLTAWYAKALSAGEESMPLITLNKMTLDNPDQADRKIEKVMLVNPSESIEVLMKEWLPYAEKLGVEVTKFSSEWKSLIAGKKKGMALISVDDQGVKHLEGWATYEVFPIFGYFLSNLEVAPWNREDYAHRRLKGVGSLLVAKRISGSFKNNFSGRCFLHTASDEARRLFEGMGAKSESLKLENKDLLYPFYRLSSRASYEIVDDQNKREGNVQVVDLTDDEAMQASAIRNDWFEPYRINGYSDEQIEELQVAAATSKPYSRSDSFTFETQEKINEVEFLKSSFITALKTSTDKIVITSLGPGGEKAEEPIEAAKIALTQMSLHPKNKRDIFIVAYDQSIEGLQNLKRILVNKIQSLEDQFPSFKGRIHFKVLYGDFSRGKADNSDYWKAMTLPSNITIWRHTWVMDQGLTLDDVKAMAEVLESKVTSGGLLVREYDPYRPMDENSHLIIHKIISNYDSSSNPAMQAEIQQGFNYALGKVIGMGANIKEAEIHLLTEPDSAFDGSFVQRTIQSSDLKLTFAPGVLYNGAPDLIQILNEGQTEKDSSLTRIVQNWGTWVFSKEYQNPCIVMLTTDVFDQYRQQGKASLKFIGKILLDPHPQITLAVKDFKEIWVSEDTWEDIQNRPDSLGLSQEGRKRLRDLLDENKIKPIRGLHHKVIGEKEDRETEGNIARYVLTRNLLKEIPAIMPEFNKESTRVTTKMGAVLVFDPVNGRLIAIESKDRTYNIDQYGRIIDSSTKDGIKKVYAYDEPGYALKITQFKNGNLDGVYELEENEPMSDAAMTTRIKDKPIIFMVDDQAKMRDDWRKWTEDIADEYHVEIFSSPQSALRRLQNVKPSLIITDTVMPEIDGPTFIQEVKKIHPKGISFVAVSAEGKNLAEYRDMPVTFYPKAQLKKIDLINLIHKKVPVEVLIKKTKVDKSSKAMITEPLGGIDMNSDLLNLTIKRDKQGMPLPLALQNWSQIRINGLEPVIIKIEPVNLVELIGL